MLKREEAASSRLRLVLNLLEVSMLSAADNGE